ncbi:MAG: DUF2141 domain-containing protein, partial [Cytophagaceae bacterium]
MKKIILFFSLFALWIPLQAQDKGKLIINVSDIRSDEGNIKVTIYTTEDGFPMDPDKAIKIVYGDIKAGRAKIVIDGLEEGTYAFALLHDENKNDKSDSNWIGMPKEGIAASNNAKGSFGPPK